MTDAPARHYDIIAFSEESTVVAEYTPDPRLEDSYQSEAALEREFIDTLTSQAYEYLPITSEADLIANLRRQLEALNGVTFSDTEWQRFFDTCIAGSNDSIADKTRRIQEDHVQVLVRDDGTRKNIRLIDKNVIHNNRLQVINQYEVPGASDGGSARRSNRYDVTILVNGLPLIHVELKRRGVDIREAFNQIERYQRDSFWAGSGLFGYVQIFVISNGTLTKYYSNTTREQHLKEAGKRRNPRQTSHSFEFTSWWADATNRPIYDLISFAKTFFAKHSILAILTRYCVLTAQGLLLVMRPYQIVATERILQKILTSTTYKQLGTLDSGGYVWHTTGSGKTLTSFKTAQLAARLEDIDRVIFVVDRKDLDHQTRLEYERFSPGSVNGNDSTAALRRQLTLPVGTPLETRGTEIITNRKILVTTIQKLSRFVNTEKNHPIFGQHVVLIFDECHRSQFGQMHTDITRSFKRYHIFGFTGTPIFSANSGSGGNPQLKTTAQAFGEKLHTYTIVDAITDRNVLPFRMDYVNTVKVGNVNDHEVGGIETASALMAPERMKHVVRYILEHFDRKTMRHASYTLRGARARGFNALFATESIKAARAYYNIFRLLQDDLPFDQRLKVGIIYSYAPNEATDDVDGILGEEEFETLRLDDSSRDFLEDAIQDYNDMYGTNFDTSADNFQKYYEHLADRIKLREIDLVIVVNMFLTGFDATTLNTLFVDKNLRAHGLIQAYSRTNRILNSVKTHGNIVSFRNLEQETEDAIALFGNKDAGGIVLLKPYAEYYGEYADKVNELLTRFPLGAPIIGEDAEKEFIAIYGAIRRLMNILKSFDQFEGEELLNERAEQDFTGIYVKLYHEYRLRSAADKEDIREDVVFEIELIKQVEINVDYILMLVERYRSQYGNGEDIEIKAQIMRSVAASPTLRNKSDLVEAFVESVSAQGDIQEQWTEFIAQRRDAELSEIIDAERLKRPETEDLLERSFRDGQLYTAGQSLTRILPPVSRFSAGGAEGVMRTRVTELLRSFFERFNGLGAE